MSDIIDEANDLIAARVQDEIERNRAVVREIPKGEEGHCQSCGDHSLRLVYKHCAPCRDGRE